MNLRDLEYLQALAIHKSFKRAAAAIPISQPTLSIQINKLEQHLGVKLLERDKKSVSLTEIGEEVATKANLILSTAKEIEQLAETAKDPSVGTLRLGIFPTLAPYLLPRIITPLEKRFPKLSILFHEHKSRELISMLKDHQLDVALLSETENLEEFETIPLFTEELLVAVSRKNKLAAKKAVSFSDLANEKLLLLEDGHCLRDQVVNLCEAAKLNQQLNFTTTSLETIRQLVAANKGVTIMPKLAASNHNAISYLPLVKPAAIRKICIAFKVGSPKEALIQQLAILAESSVR